MVENPENREEHEGTQWDFGTPDAWKFPIVIVSFIIIVMNYNEIFRSKIGACASCVECIESGLNVGVN